MSLDEYVEDDYGMEDEFGAHERAAGFMHYLLPEVLMGGRLEKIQKKLKRMQASEDEKFAEVVWIYLNKYKDYFTKEDWTKILDSIAKVEDIEYKNPCAYIFGYYVIQGNRIDKKNLDKIFKLIRDEDIEIVSPPDIIRYARFWIKNDI